MALVVSLGLLPVRICYSAAESGMWLLLQDTSTAELASRIVGEKNPLVAHLLRAAGRVAASRPMGLAMVLVAIDARPSPILRLAQEGRYA